MRQSKLTIVTWCFKWGQDRIVKAA
jgi:hypothetical protein